MIGRKFTLTLTLLVTTMAASAQSLETVEQSPTGYMTTCYYTQGNTIKTIDGVLYMVYADVPMVLLRYPAMNPREEFEVPSTVRRIANNAFQGTRYLRTLRLHSTVSYGLFSQLTVGESAFNDSSIENFEVIEDNVTSGTEVRPETPLTPPTEVARYDLAGRPVVQEQGGVQIITYDDHTARKVLK